MLDYEIEVTSFGRKLSIGKFIRELRLKAGYKTQKDLSVASGVSQTTLSRVEAEIQKPLPDTLMALSKVFAN